MLEEHFSDAEIVKRLSRMRAKFATAEHEHMRLELIAPLGGSRTPNDYEAQVRKLFPPRAGWTRPRKRDGLTREGLTAQAAFSGAMRALNSSTNASEPHVIELRAFIHDLRLAALSDEPYVFQPPEIIPFRKERGSSVYRAIGRLGLRDAVVESIVAKYLRQCFDPDFLDCALAYRCGSAGHPAPTHHDAMRAMLGFAEANVERRLWVVEIDIRKFYDSVGHDVALRAVDRAVDRAARRGVAVDTRALAILSAFIASYSFPRNVLSGALPGLRARDPNATFGWPGEDGALDEFYPDPMAADVGIIQGAALSCLIANLILHDADVAVTKRKSKSQRLYIRYSDDMALMCTSIAAAKADMQKYLAAMKALHLPIHEPKPGVQYGREFWSEKSRGPYRFTNHPSGAPVFGLVGYQLHVDGHLRLRPSSLRKQIDRIHDETDKVVRRLLSVGRDGIRQTGRQIVNLLEGRLVGMAVGRRNPGSRPGELSQNCFAAGWKLLAEHPHQRGQLRVLDRERGHSMHRLRRVLRMLGVPIEPPVGSKGKRKGRSRFFGIPFSYAGQYPRHLSLGKGPRP
jgi:hypothetical protein